MGGVAVLCPTLDYGVIPPRVEDRGQIFQAERFNIVLLFRAGTLQIAKDSQSFVLVLD